MKTKLKASVVWVLFLCVLALSATPASAKKIRKGETISSDETVMSGTPVMWSGGEQTVNLVAKGIGIGDAVRLLPCAVQFENVGDTDSTKISVNLRGVSLKQALGAICSQAGYGYEVVNEGLVKIYQFKNMSYTLPVTPLSEDYTASMTGGNQSSATGGSSGSSGSPGGSSGSSGSGNGNPVAASGDMSLRHTSKVDLWTNVQNNLKSIMGENGVVTTDPRSSMVFVRCPAAYVSSVDAYMRQLLDALLLSVEIEISIVDITYNNNNHFGLDWELLFKNISFDNGLKFFAGGPGSFVLDKGVKGLGDSFGFGFTHKDGQGSQTAVLQALNKFANVKIVERTNLHLRNNTAASLRRGENIPYIDSITQTVTGGTTAAVQTAVQKGNVLSGVDIAVMASVYRDMVSIAVTPRVTQLLEIEEIKAAGTTIQNPKTRVRENLIQVLLADGQTAVVAGAKSSKDGSESTGIPGLVKLPVLGPLFGIRDSVNEGGQIVMMITPRIIQANSQLVSVQ